MTTNTYIMREMQDVDIPEFYFVRMLHREMVLYIDQQMFDYIIESESTICPHDVLESIYEESGVSGPYNPARYGNWGLDNQFMFEGVEEGWVKFSMFIPRPDPYMNYPRSFEFSLDTLMTAMRFSRRYTQRRTHQLVAFQAISTADDGNQTCGIQVSIARRAAKILRIGSDTITDHTMKVMKDHVQHVYGVLFDQSIFGECIASVNPTYYQRVPGFCACMGVQDGRVAEGGGYELEDHNMDSRFHRLLHIVGIAAMHDKVRQLDQADQ